MNSEIKEMELHIEAIKGLAALGRYLTYVQNTPKEVIDAWHVIAEHMFPEDDRCNT